MNQNEMTNLDTAENQFKSAQLDNQTPWHPLSVAELELLFTLARQGLQFQGERRDGSWVDQFGACRVCDGEIPHGHAENCDLYKLEQQISTLTAELEALRKDGQRLEQALSHIGFFFAGTDQQHIADKVLLVINQGKTIDEAITIDSAMEKEKSV